MTSITLPSGTTNTFTYNGLDTRVQKVDSTGTFTYRRDGVGVTDPVLNDSAAEYTPGISESRGGTSKFYHSDRLGTTTKITDSTATTTDTRTYDAFGLLVSSTGTTPTPFGFVGRQGYQEDPDTGLKLLGHRYYDPSTGRFLTRDPKMDGRNWYVYASSASTVLADPTGHGAGTGIGGTIGGIIGFAIGGPGGAVAFAFVGGAIGSMFDQAQAGDEPDATQAKMDGLFCAAPMLLTPGVEESTGTEIGGASNEVPGYYRTVSRWPGTGTGEPPAGSWVMAGPKNRWYYTFSFKWQPEWMPGRNMYAGYKTGQEYLVDPGRVHWPSGPTFSIDGWWKGLFGQRIYK